MCRYGRLIDAHTHRRAALLKVLKQRIGRVYYQVFSIKIMQNNTSFLVSLEDEGQSRQTKNCISLFLPLGLLSFLCVKELGFSKRAVSGTRDNISKVLASTSKDRLVLGH